MECVFVLRMNTFFFLNMAFYLILKTRKQAKCYEWSEDFSILIYRYLVDI